MLQPRRVLVLYSSMFPPPLAAITPCHLAVDLRQGKISAISKLRKIKENRETPRSRSRESREFREFPRIPLIGVLASPRERRLTEFELLLVDFQGLDPGLEGRWWNSKLCRRSGRSGNPPSSLSERRLDNFPLASRLKIQSRRRLNPSCPRGSSSGKPQLIN